MQLSEELQYQIALTQLKGVGSVLAKNLIAYCGNAKNVFTSNKQQLEKIPGIGTIIAKNIGQQKDALLIAEKEIDFITKHNIKPLYFTDKNYPQRLKNCHDNPILLYYKGSCDLNTKKIVAVVGTRTPSDYGTTQTEKLIKELIDLNCIVVSGLAYGIDVLAHKLCLDNNIDTLGVLAHGLDRIYPAQHANIAQKMVLQGGLLTEFISKTNPDKENFPKRNRIVAGMCDALVILESKKEGGSLITATIANSYNRDVFAYPGKSGDVLSEGCNALIKTNKAHLIESAADLFYIMNWTDEKIKTTSTQLPLLLNLTDDEELIVKCLTTKTTKHTDDICAETNFSTGKVSSLLLQLEFSNVVKSLPGKLYKLVN